MDYALRINGFQCPNMNILNENKVDSILHLEFARVKSRISKWHKRNEWWGPIVWRYLHRSAVEWDTLQQYPELLLPHQYTIMYEWISRVYEIVPCPDCRTQLRKRTAFSHSLINTPGALSRFFFDLHNDINIKLGHPVITWNDACRIWGITTGSDDENVVENA